MADSPFTPPPGQPRRPPAETLYMMQKHAKECAVMIGKQDFAEEFKTGLFEMNGRDAILAFMLSEALERIDKLEMTNSLLLAATDCLIDDVAALKKQISGGQGGDSDEA